MKISRDQKNNDCGFYSLGVRIAWFTAVITGLKEGWMDSLRNIFLGVADGVGSYQKKCY